MTLRDAARLVLPYGIVRAIRRRNLGIVGRYRTWEEALRATGPYRPEMAMLIESVRKYRDGEPSFLNRYDRSVTGGYLVSGARRPATAGARCERRLTVGRGGVRRSSLPHMHSIRRRWRRAQPHIPTNSSRLVCAIDCLAFR